MQRGTPRRQDIILSAAWRGGGKFAPHLEISHTMTFVPGKPPQRLCASGIGERGVRTINAIKIRQTDSVKGRRNATASKNKGGKAPARSLPSSGGLAANSIITAYTGPARASFRAVAISGIFTNVPGVRLLFISLCFITLIASNLKQNAQNTFLY